MGLGLPGSVSGWRCGFRGGRYSWGMKQAGFIVAGLSVGLGGCLERRVSITSEPPGAVVTMNDVELGRTPVEADFTYYGVYDLRIEHEGYEPLRTTARASTPVYDYVPFDLAATAMPFTLKKVVPWHFELAASPELTLPPEQAQAELIERAKKLRTMMPEQ